MTEKKEDKELKVEDIRKLAEEKSCPLQKALYYISEFYSGPMCGRCFPCALGSYEAKIRLQKIIDNNGTEKDIEVLKTIAGEMLAGSMCKKGKDTAQFILQWMAEGIFEEHVNGVCRDKSCRAFIEYRIIPEKCNNCGICVDACKYSAIFGEKAKPFHSGYLPFEIRQKKCVKCDDCLHVCPTGAIVIVDAKKDEPVGV